ncbi:MAG: LGFP repeat-containing protein, partial [Croceibacterium sp.]
MAAATPDSDAADAINRAYDASGGVTGPMGPSDGGVYPIGGGFGQNYAGGKIFFTPDSGAHIMGGAILQKYESLGGPADSDLGFPTIDEGPGKVSPDSRNTTFSASDKPVIFWTPDTGAHVVRGAVNAAWDKLGGSAGPLGVPTEDEVYKGDIVSQKFTGGELTWNRSSKEFTTVPPELAGQLAGLSIPEDATSAINAARRAAGGPLGPLGDKQGPQYAIGADGAGQAFTGGKIFYSPATGANVVTGQVLKKYESVGGPQSDLGLPTSNETDGGLKTGSRVSTFSADDKPLIFWTPDYGAFIVRGAMNAAWDKLGGAAGPLGPPVADQAQNGNVVSQRFTGGEISWDKQTNKFSSEPANLASGLAGLTVPGYKAPDTSSAAAATSEKRDWFKPSWWWLLAAIPLLVLIGLILVASLRNRGGGEADLDDDFDVDAVHDDGAG